MTDVERHDDPGEYDVGAAPSVTSASAFRHVPATGATIRADTGPDETPVPHDPPHLCPTCGYNLAGLVSRRCPECGKPFQVSAARRAGGSLTEDDREDYAVIKKDNTRLLVALALIVVGYGVPAAVMGLSLGLWILSGMVGGLLVIGSISKFVFGFEWRNMLLVAGIITITLGLLFLMM